MKNGPAFVVDHNVLYQLVSDAAFFRRVPALFFMKDQAESCAKAFAAGECGQCSPQGAMGPAMATFVRTLVKLKTEAPEMLEPLVAYIVERRPYRPQQILVYYRGASQEIKTITL